MKIAVIDIGTRATRLLVSDKDDLDEYGFRFSDCVNFGSLTEIGNALYQEEDETLCKIKCLEKFFNYIDFLLNKCSKLNVDPKNIYGVGTEVFRKISNRDGLKGNRTDLIKMIKDFHGIDVKILDPKEEAECTFWAAIISCKEYFDIDEPILVMEQGGGSMQITVASVNAHGKPQRYGQVSIPDMGTLLLRKRFLLHQESQRRIGTINRDVLKYAKDKVSKILSSEFSLSDSQKPLKAFALGSAITNLFRNLRSLQVHGKIVPLATLKDPAVNRLLENYKTYTIASLLNDIENGHLKESKRDIDTELEIGYGLPCYAAVMEHFNLEELRVCGTGLRYGIFFRVAADEWLDIREYNG